MILVFKSDKLIDILSNQQLVCKEYNFSYRSFTRKRFDKDGLKEYKGYKFIKLVSNVFGGYSGIPIKIQDD